jgi:hypothetical protein
MATRTSHARRNDGMRVECAFRVTQTMRIARCHARSRDAIGAMRST